MSAQSPSRPPARSAVPKRRRGGRKLLVASVGVATVSFVGVGCSTTSVANLPAPPSCEVAPQDPSCIGPHPDAGADAGTDGDAGGGDDADGGGQ